jgi:hypothetical protein
VEWAGLRAQALDGGFEGVKGQQALALGLRTLLSPRPAGSKAVTRPSTDDDRFRRISVGAGYSGDGLFTEPIAVAQPWRREPLFVVESECGAVAVGRA